MHWARAALADERAVVVGAWDADAERGMAAAGKIGVEFRSDLNELLSSVDAAMICAPNSEKVDLVEKAAAHGVHILCEKPTAASLDQVRRMMKAVNQHGVQFVQSFPHRLVPANQRIKTLLDEGFLGKVGMVRKRHGHGFALKGLAENMPWIVDPELGGGGALLDEGIHEMDLLRYYFGDPVSVTAEIGTLQTELLVEDQGAAVFRFPNDIIVELSAGWTWLAGGPTTEIYGTRGTILQFFTDCASNDAPDPAGMHLRVWRRESDSWEDLGERFSFTTIHENMARHFISVLVDGEPACAGIEDGYKALEMALAAYVSAREGRRIDFPPSSQWLRKRVDERPE